MSFPVGPFKRLPLGGGAKAFPPFFPLNFAGLEEYYDSRALGGVGVSPYSNGATVTSAKDLSGHSTVRDMATAGLPGGMVGPTFLANAFPKGPGGMTFNGTNSGLTTGTINPFPAATNGHSFHTYARWRNTTAPPAAFAGAVIWMTSLFGSVPKELGLQSVGSLLAYWRDSGGFHLDSATPTGIKLLSFVFTPPNIGKFYVNGVEVLSSAYTLAAATADTTSFSDTINNNVPLNADLGYFFWASRAHTAAQIAQILAWTRIYWGGI